MILYVLVIFASYLIGALSFGAMVAKIHGIDIFSVGSRSPGATNIKRVIGGKYGQVVFILDFIKGLIPCWCVVNFFNSENHLNLKLAVFALIGILLGHSFSVFYKFRGGKGIASTMGGLLAIMPNTFIIGALVWVVIFHATRIVSFASLCFTASILLTSYLFSYPKECVFLALAINIMIFWRHKDNIIRLAKGTEYKFTKKN